MVERVTQIPPVTPTNSISSSTPISDGSNSSLEAAEFKEVYSPSKPTLTSPIGRMLDGIVGRLEPTVDRWSRFKESSIEAKCKEVEDLNRQEIAKIQEAQDAAKDVTFWGILEDIGNSIMGAVSFTLGFSAVSAGAPVVGGALIVSGALSVGNLAFKHMQVWDYLGDQIAGKDENLKYAIKNYVPSAVGLTAAAMGIYGSFSAWSYTAQAGTSLLQGTANIATALATYSSGMANSAIKNVQADLSFLQSNLSLSKLSMQVCTDDLRNFHERQMHTFTNVGKLLEETDNAIQVIQQPV
ncbi:MAG: hypothetical protein P0S96_04480 [Simkaniaceae bacterium]|nr:hypothetical protein [Candidatus Sacchlamyda saccharinae]